MSFQRGDECYDINVNLLDMGKGKVDTGIHDPGGRVVGEKNNPYALAIDF